MKKSDIEKKLNDISIRMLEFEYGDLMLLSELLDNMSELMDFFRNQKDGNKISCIIYNILDKLLKNEIVNDAGELISNGIDLLARVFKSNNKDISDLLLDDINNYLEKINKNNIPISDGSNNKNIKKPIKAAREEFSVQLSSDSIKIFITEAEERMISSQEKIMKLEEDPSDKSIINELFRNFHTIKGECGFLKLIKMGEVTHSVENLLDLLRYDEINNDPDIIDLLLNGVDIVFEMLKALKNEDKASYQNVETDQLIELIRNISEKKRMPIGEILEKNTKLSNEDVSKIIEEQKSIGFTKKFGEIAVEENFIDEEELDESLKKQKSLHQVIETKSLKNDPIIKVKASQINYLVDMVGELLIAENQLEDKKIVQLRKITKQIQNAAMMLRTIKVKNLFINMKRVVRDLAKKLNKEVNVTIIGEDLEIDRNLVEAVEEPLVHILRNAMGHGIESTEERNVKNKNAEGEIIIKAGRHGNNIVISIRDDGRGLDKDKILKKAITNSLIDEERAKALKENEIYNFIFMPGFSTANQVDNVSGRGVGMDVVKSTVTSLRGKVEVFTKPGEFTEIDLIFPLSMAIIDGMIVSVEDVQFIIPVSNIIESLSINDEMLYTVKNREAVINLRGEIIPVIILRKYFDLFDEYKTDIEISSCKLAVIVESNKRKYALIVDELIAKKEIVIKTLGEKFKDLRAISSGAILSAGKVGFVINIDEIVELAESKTMSEIEV